jgi:hypothetical protein
MGRARRPKDPRARPTTGATPWSPDTAGHLVTTRPSSRPAAPSSRQDYYALAPRTAKGTANAPTPQARSFGYWGDVGAVVSREHRTRPCRGAVPSDVHPLSKLVNRATAARPPRRPPADPAPEHPAHMQLTPGRPEGAPEGGTAHPPALADRHDDGGLCRSERGRGAGRARQAVRGDGWHEHRLTRTRCCTSLLYDPKTRKPR